MMTLSVIDRTRCKVAQIAAKLRRAQTQVWHCEDSSIFDSPPIRPLQYTYASFDAMLGDQAICFLVALPNSISRTPISAPPSG